MAEDTGGVTADRLRSFVERLENLEEEKRATQEQIKEVFAEAKGEGYDVKILKEVIRLRKQDRDERDEHGSLLDLYMNAIEGAPEAQAA